MKVPRESTVRSSLNYSAPTLESRGVLTTVHSVAGVGAVLYAKKLCSESETHKSWAGPTVGWRHGRAAPTHASTRGCLADALPPSSDGARPVPWNKTVRTCIAHTLGRWAPSPHCARAFRVPRLGCPSCRSSPSRPLYPPRAFHAAVVCRPCPSPSHPPGCIRGPCQCHPCSRRAGRSRVWRAWRHGRGSRRPRRRPPWPCPSARRCGVHGPHLSRCRRKRKRPSQRRREGAHPPLGFTVGHCSTAYLLVLLPARPPHGGSHVPRTRRLRRLAPPRTTRGRPSANGLRCPSPPK